MTVTDELSTLFVEVWEQKNQLPPFILLTKVKCKLLKENYRNEESCIILIILITKVMKYKRFFEVCTLCI